MEALEKQALCAVLALLVLSSEVERPLLTGLASRGTEESAEQFLSRLEGYLKDAMPPDSAPVNESEYVIPEGLDASEAERLWKALGAFVSQGFSQEEVRRLLANTSVKFQLPDGGGAFLNFSGTELERSTDGSVRLKVPVVANASLSYLHYNSTNLRVLYEVWNETLVRYYKVENFSCYRYTIRDLETGREYEVVSTLEVGCFSSGLMGVKRTEVIEEPRWGLAISALSSWVGITSSTPVVAVPGHYEEVKVLVPEHKEGFRVLFPSYDPLIYTGWLVGVELSSTSLTVGDILRINFSAYPVGIDPSVDALDANLSLQAPSAFEVLGDSSAHLDNSNRSGRFELRALCPGTYNLTLRLDGDANFDAWPSGKELSLTVQLVAPGSPSVSVSISSVDTSVLKHARVAVEIRNEGGGTARDLLVEVTGSSVKPVSRDLGELGAGDAKCEIFDLRLLRESSSIVVRLRYRDDDNNSYLVETATSVWSKNFFVPEHFEDYTATVPEHFETVKVFVPGYEGYTHVRFYAFVLDWMTSVPGVYVAPKFEEDSYYGGFELHAVMMPCALYGFEMDISKDLSERARERANVSLMLTKIEPFWEEVGTFVEGDAAEVMGVGVKQLRGGELPSKYRARVSSSYWVRGESVVMNATEFELFKLRMQQLTAGDGDLRYGYKVRINATRAFEEVDSSGHVVFIYRPLSLKGNGPLRSMVVRNYAARNVSYALKVLEPVPSVPQFVELPTTYSSEVKVQGLGAVPLLSSSLVSDSRRVRVRLLCGRSVVAELDLELTPETSRFWAGFWDGLRPKLVSVVLSSAVMIFVGVTTGMTGAALWAGVTVGAIMSMAHYLLGGGSELAEVAGAFRRGVNCLSAANELMGMAASLEADYPKLSEVARSAAMEYLASFGENCLDTVLKLGLGVGVDDFLVALGVVKVEDEYVQGYACGSVTGTVLSLASYVLVYSAVGAVEGAEAKGVDFVKTVRQAVYNWVTPALWDLAEAVRNRQYLVYVALWRKASTEFSEFLSKLRDLKLEELESISDSFRKVVGLLGRLREEAVLMLADTSGHLMGIDRTGGLSRRYLDAIEDIAGADEGFADAIAGWAEAGRRGKKLDSAVVDVLQRVSEEVDPEEFGRLGRAFEGVSGNFEDGFLMLKSYLEIPDKYEDYGKDAVDAVKETFTRQVNKDKATALAAWAEAIENGRIAAKVISSGTGSTGMPVVGMRISKGLADAFGVGEGSWGAILVKGNDEIGEVALPAWLSGEADGMFPVYSKRGLFTALGLKAGQYVQLSFDFKDAEILEVTDAGVGEDLILRVGGVDSRVIEAKGGEGFYSVKLELIGDGKGNLLEESKGFTTIRHIEGVEGDMQYFTSLGPGLYRFRIEKIEQDAVAKLANSELVDLGLKVTPAPEGGEFVVKWHELKAKSGQWYYEPNLEPQTGISEVKVKGGLIIPFDLAQDWDGAILVTANPLTGRLESVLGFRTVNEEGWIRMLSANTVEITDEKGDKKVLLEVSGDKSGKRRYGLLEWNEKDGCYEPFFATVLTSKFKEIDRDFTEKLVSSLDTSRLTIKGDIAIYMFPECIEDAYWRARGLLEEHAKGVSAAHMVKVLLYLDEFRSWLEVDQGWGDPIVDELGKNEGDYIFDMFFVDDINERFAWVGEIKSVWTEGWNPSSKLNEAQESLKNIIQHIGEKTKDTKYSGWKLGVNAYCIGMHITENGIEFRKAKYSG